MIKWKLDDEIKVTSVNESDERAVKMSTNGGIDVLIPGRVYSDNNANSKKFIFVGYGNITRGKFLEEGVYVYISCKTFEKGLQKKVCSMDFEILAKTTIVKGVYRVIKRGGEYFTISRKPRVMLEDHGELYPSSTFDNLVFDDATFERKPCVKIAKIKGKKNVGVESLCKEEPATMETAVNIKKLVPEYKGLEVQVPGRVYMEQNTNTPYIFFGYCSAESNWKSIPEGEVYAYLDYGRYVRAIKRGEINPEMTISNIGENGTLLHGVKFMRNPKIIIEDMGKLFDEKYFNDVVIHDGVTAYHIVKI